MNTSKCELSPDFEQSSIINELELKDQDYLLSDIKELYENGTRCGNHMLNAIFSIYT